MVSGAPDDKRSRLAGQGLGGGVQGLRFRGLTRTKRRKMFFFEGSGGGCKGFGSGGVGGRDTGPRDGANFATCVVFLLFLTRTKRRKMAFFEGCPVGWGGVPTGAGLVDGGVDQGPWLQERVGGVVFLSFLMRTKRRKMAFFEGCPVGGGGYPPELAWWTGG